MAKIFDINRPNNKITFGTTGTTINVASHTASKTLALDASKNLESIQDLRVTASPTFAGATIGSVVISGVYAAQGEPTGFVDRVATLSWNDGTYTLTITGSHDIYIYGIKTTKSTDSIQIADTTGLHWIYYDASGTLVENTVHPGWDLPIMATVYWNTTGSAGNYNKGLAGEERHGIVMDWAVHEYLHETVGCRWESGLAGTFDNTTLSIATGEWHDEDIHFIEASPLTTCNVLYKNGDANWEWDAGVSVYYKLNGTALRYNNGNNLADCTPNRYMAMWIFITSDISTPIVALMGQRQDTTLASARANNTYESLSFGTLPFKEMKLLYRVILRSTGSPPTYTETQDYRAISNLPAGTYVATTHGVLTGLTNDDHTQYIKDAEFTQNSGILVGTGTGTFQEETGATLRTSLGLGTGNSPQFTAVNIGHASDTTITRVSAGVIAVEGTNVMLVGAAPTAHTHDTDTLQLDAVNSDGGAFSFTTSGTVTFNQPITTSKTCTAAAGLNVLRVTGLQTDGTAMTGTLRGAYIDVSNGSTAATGTIRGMELKARTEAPGDTGNDVTVLEGLSISADSKGHSVTTLRAAEFIIDGSAGGTLTEAVGLRIANNLQANKATASYGLQIYRDSFDYTYDISLSLGGHITGSCYATQDYRTSANPQFAGLGLGVAATAGTCVVRSLGAAPESIFVVERATSDLLIVGYLSDGGVDSTALHLKRGGTTLVYLSTKSTEDSYLNIAGNIGFGVQVPKTKVTIEGALTLKEQAAADGDTAAYGQLWCKTVAPNQLWFTDDAGRDFRLTADGDNPTTDDSQSNAMLIAHAYLAQCTGFVTAYAGAATTSNIQGYVGTTTDPENDGTRVQYTDGPTGHIPNVSFMVAKGKYFEITAGVALTITWTPLVTGGAAPLDQD